MNTSSPPGLDLNCCVYQLHRWARIDVENLTVEKDQFCHKAQNGKLKEQSQVYNGEIHEPLASE